MKKEMTDVEMIESYKKLQIQRRNYTKKYNDKLKHLAKLGQKYLDEQNKKK